MAALSPWTGQRAAADLLSDCFQFASRPQAAELLLDDDQLGFVFLMAFGGRYLRRRGCMSKRAASLVILGFLSATPLLAQTAPCGRIIVAVTDQDSPKEERFLPAAPEHVRTCTLKALPVLGAKLKGEDGTVVKAETDWRGGLWDTWIAANRNAGVKGANAGTLQGSWTIQLRPETRDGVAGTIVTIDYRKIALGTNKNGASPLMEEIACLSKLLSPSNPLTDPRGLIDPETPTEPRTVTLPEGTPVKLLFHDPVFSKDVFKKDKEKRITDVQLVFEVAADVRIDGVVLIRRGALATGRLTEDAKAVGWSGRSASLTFVIDQVTAVDGRPVAVVGAIERQRQRDVVLPSHGNLSPLANRLAQDLAKGSEALIRAGTAYDAETVGIHAVRVGK